MFGIAIVLLMILLISRIMLKEKEIDFKSKAPLILIIIGLLLTIDIIHAYHDNMTMYLYMIATCITGLVFGLIRGTTIKVWLDPKSNKWMKKGTIITVIIFIIGIAVNVGIEKLLFPDFVSGLNTIMTTLHIGVTLYAVKIMLKRKIA
ncbi:hypothetical protein [Staphylococcus caeli]|uniref:hypothetical protein n=1 Tax=Staphylococcus caeli TaxID=2201815 RepID=UPI003F5431C4